MSQVEHLDRTKPLPWAVIGFVLFTTFLAGFITGVISDGTVEIVNDFNRKHPTVRVIERADETPGPSQPASAAENSQPVVPKPNGQIDWSIKVAPGTDIATLDVSALKLSQPYRLRFYSVQRGAPPAMVATLWLEGGSKATISLPSGLYKVGGTRIGGDIPWDERAGDETILKRPMAIRILDPDEATATMMIAKDGAISSSAMLSVPAKEKPAPKAVRRNSNKGEYEGLGTSAKNGGTDTYGSAAISEE